MNKEFQYEKDVYEPNYLYVSSKKDLGISIIDCDIGKSVRIAQNFNRSK